MHQSALTKIEKGHCMTHALYYPTIEFGDLECLKRSLLLWDRVFRIVPPNYQPDDSGEVRTAVAEGAVVDILVDQTEKSNAAHEFLDFYYTREHPTNPLVWPAGFSDETFTRLNPEKIDAKLTPLFEQLSARLTSDGFMEVPPELAAAYMFYLANSVASQRSLDLVSDSSDCWTVGTFFANNGNFTEQVYAENADAYLANLAINDLLPDNVGDVPIDYILRFRTDHVEQRTAFQRELASLREELSRCHNKQHARYIVNDFIKRFERAKAEYKDSLGFFNKNDVFSILSVGLPVALGIISAGNDPYAPLRLGIGTLIGAVSSLAHKELILKEKTVASYLVSSERFVNTSSKVLNRKFQEFIND